MAKSDTRAVDLATMLITALNADLKPHSGRLGKIKRYLEGQHDLPYIPKGATNEFKRIAQNSITNWLPLVPAMYGQGLFVDGYRPARSADNAKAWEWWQLNGMDARQSISTKGALCFGAAYDLVLPGDRAPVMKPLSPLRSYALYEDEDDEFPEVGIFYKGKTVDGNEIYWLVDDEAVYEIAHSKDSISGESEYFVTSVSDHHMGVTPLVRFRTSIGEESRGIVSPLITLQNRINEVVFNLMIALQYASFRQRWATGLAIPTGDDGNPVEPFQAAVNRLWVSDSADAKFGDFAQTEVNGHVQTYESTVRTFAALAQISPNILTGDLVNLSADALAQMANQTQQQLSEFKTLLGEPRELEFRLAAKAAGDTTGWQDTSSQVKWRDTQPQSFESTVKALGDVATLLHVPPQELWEKVPNTTDQDVERWKKAASRPDAQEQLAQEMLKQAQTGLTDG